MALETGTYISDLVVTNPTSSDPKSQGDDHFRLVKSTIKNSFPGVTGAVTPTHTELNYVDGVTSAIQTQIDLKAPLDSPSLTGAPTSVTPAVGDNSTKIATTEFVVAASLTASLPGQTGKDFYLLSTDGVTANWYNTIDTSVVTPVAGTALATTTGTQTLANKTVTSPVIADSSDTTKKANFILSGITAGQNRNITVKDNNIILDTPGWVRLSNVTASASATVDLETTIDSTYDRYVVVISGMRAASASANLYARFKIGGSYLSGASDYVYTSNYTTDVNAVSKNFSGIAQIIINSSMDSTGSTTDRYLSAIIHLDSPSSTTFLKHIRWNSGFYTTGGAPDTLAMVDGFGVCSGNAGAVTGIRFLMSTGNITEGKFTLFGIRS